LPWKASACGVQLLKSSSAQGNKATSKSHNGIYGIKKKNQNDFTLNIKSLAAFGSFLDSIRIFRSVWSRFFSASRAICNAGFCFFLLASKAALFKTFFLEDGFDFEVPLASPPAISVLASARARRARVILLEAMNGYLWYRTVR
jgi:hypothetical protein